MKQMEQGSAPVRLRMPAPHGFLWNIPAAAGMLAPAARPRPENRNEGRSMSINFNSDSVWNLKEIDTDSVRSEVKGLLTDGEKVEMAFRTVRDQLVFTNKRIIAIDVQGITGSRKTFTTLPYARIQYFSIQTPGFAEIFSDSELFIMFSNEFTAKFEFKGKVDIGRIGRLISDYALR